jgi:hypothetical protein
MPGTEIPVKADSDGDIFAHFQYEAPLATAYRSRL